MNNAVQENEDFASVRDGVGVDKKRIEKEQDDNKLKKSTYLLQAKEAVKSSHQELPTCSGS